MKKLDLLENLYRSLTTTEIGDTIVDLYDSLYRR